MIKLVNNQDIHEVVSKTPKLSRLQMLKVVRLLMSSNPEEFYLLKSVPDDEKTEWILFLIISQSEGQFPFGLLLLRCPTKMKPLIVPILSEGDRSLVLKSNVELWTLRVLILFKFQNCYYIILGFLLNESPSSTAVVYSNSKIVTI